MSIFSNPKKKHFEKRLEALENNIYDREFQKFQSGEIREGIRLDRDRALEQMDAFEAELKREHEPATVTELTAKRDACKANADRFTAQMKMLDDEINGRPYSPGNPEKGIEADPGAQGLTDTIASLNELKKMFVSYIRTL